MKHILILCALIACLLVFASCSDDPVSTTGSGHFTPEYHPTLVSMDGDILSVCGAGNGDLYAIGPAILHYDGKRWNTIEPPTLSRFSRNDLAQGFSDGSIVVSDGQYTFLRKDGVWADITVPNGYVNELWGSSTDNLYALDYNRLRHFNGSAWADVALPGDPSSFYSMTGGSGGRLALSARYGQVFRFDGSQWTVDQLDSNAFFRHMTMTDSGRLFVSSYSEVYELTGTTLHLVLRNVLLDPVLRADHEVVYAAGRVSLDDRYFAITRLDNGIWYNVALDRGAVQSLWVGDGNIIAGGYNNFLWRGTDSGGSVEQVYPRRGGFNCATNIDGAVFLGGRSVYRYEGGAWSDLDKEYITSNDVYDIAGRNKRDVYAVGAGMVLHYDGSAWSWINAGSNDDLTSVWVDDDGDMWAGGAFYNSLYRLHAGNWSVAEVPFADHAVYDLWGADGAMFAVGSRGLAAVHQDGTWRTFDTHTREALIAIWGTNAQRVYAATSLTNQLLVFDGREWKPMPVDNAPDHYTVALWGNTPTNMFVIDNQGSLLHYDGRSWQPLERVFSEGVQAVCGTGSDVIAVSRSGAVSYRR